MIAGSGFWRPDTSSGGGTSSTDSLIVTGINLIAGNTVVNHTLGVAPQTVTFYNSTGQVQVLQWQPTPGNETTQITVTSFVPLNGVTAMLSATGSNGGVRSTILTGKVINTGNTDIIHGLGEEPQVVMFYNASGQPQILQWIPKPGAEDTTITVTSFITINPATIQLYVND